jgi:glycosyltransferase involved in cell wall biosynthesis
MSDLVRIVVPARNEATRLGALLASVSRGLQHARAHGATWPSEVAVVLDRCHDATERIARDAGAQVLQCPAPYGKVEALRAGSNRDAAVHVYLDADVVLGERTLLDLITTLQRDARVLAACPPLAPLPPESPLTPLAWALHRYNAARGFSSERLWLSGRCYALRWVDFPSPAELGRRAERTGAQRFRGARAPLLADDVWLSRQLLAQGPHAIRHVDTDPVLYRAPRSLRGMSRTYRRLRRELSRVDQLFPELPAPGRDRHKDRVRGARDRLALALFNLALMGCRAHAWLEDGTERALAWTPDPWPSVVESKR